MKEYEEKYSLIVFVHYYIGKWAKYAGLGKSGCYRNQ
ncbi:Uncharacterised protein [Bacteroides ovatus]|mgnify:CR=1 FL=1|nr:hypothetical protein Bovatus_02566 [Bacteroides ovatus]SDZ09626.1 hypothetical protein SAMN05444282_106130 [Bacteroides ovatus]SQA55186.1 Uncharacterised protein [Bacteroides ovatus]